MNLIVRFHIRKAALIGLSLSFSVLAASCQVIAIMPSQPSGTNPSGTTVVHAAESINETSIVSIAPFVPDMTPAATSTATPSPSPSVKPTDVPTPTPANRATLAPTAKPTATPTARPTTAPTAAPTPYPDECIINLPEVPINWPATSEQQAKTNQLIALVNEERAAQGLPPMIQGPSGMKQAAYIRAAEISILFAHPRPTDHEKSKEFYQLMLALGVSLQSAGENLASVPSSATSAQAAFDALKGSDGHYKNLLNFNYIAVGVFTHNGADLYAMMLVNPFPGCSP